MNNLRTMLKRHGLRVLLSIGIILFFMCHAIGIWEWQFITLLENKSYDTRLLWRMPNTKDLRIAIVDIDEKSLSELGHWPWSREKMALLFDQLFDVYHIDTLGIDVVFAEADDSSGLKVLQALGEHELKHIPEFTQLLPTLQEKLDYDALFARKLKDRKVVLGYSFVTEELKVQQVTIGQLPAPVPIDKNEWEPYTSLIKGAFGYVANITLFQNAATSAGHFISDPDSDGIVRRVPLLVNYRGALYESLSLAVTRTVLESPPIKLGIVSNNKGYQAVEFLKLGDRVIPVDKRLQALIPYRGKHPQFDYVSAVDVLKGRIAEPFLLKGKIVLLGTTAQGLMDLRATPVDNVYPGVEVHANLIAGMLDTLKESSNLTDNPVIYSPSYTMGFEVSLLIVIGMIMTIVIPLLSPLLATVSTLVAFIVFIGMNFYFWQHYHWVFPMANITLMMLTSFIFNMSYGYFVEATNKRHLHSLFGQYIPPELVDEMSKNVGTKVSIEGESREMTVLFSDVRGFTTISEGLTPKELSELMNAYLTPMTQVIHRNHGTIDKYIGDAIMAFWGAPLPDNKHATHAIAAALEMLKRLKELHPQFKENGWPEIKIGIGLNTGTMSVGNMGSEFRMAYTVMGDAVNLGSRLEGITKEYGVQLLVSETTCRAAPEYVYRELDRVRVKGKDVPVVIYEPVGLHGEIDTKTSTELAHYEEALDRYRRQQWESAKEQFVRLKEKYPTRLLYSLYLERIAYFMQHPPMQNWDGVYTFKTK